MQNNQKTQESGLLARVIRESLDKNTRVAQTKKTQKLLKKFAIRLF